MEKNTILLPCPNCGTKKEVETTIDVPESGVYQIYEIPVDDLSELNGTEHECPACRSLFAVRAHHFALMELIREGK